MGPVGVTNPQAATVESAVARIADARCEREVSCENVGTHKKFATRQVCVEDARQSESNDLQGANCASGVDDGQLDKCLTSIRGQPCASAIASTIQLDACRASLLCSR
jgi:hypothetical protein